MNDSCGTCRFSAVVPEPKFPGLIECRCRPPVPGNRPIADWPQVHSDAWCGEYETRPVTSKPARKPRPAAGDVETRL